MMKKLLVSLLSALLCISVVAEPGNSQLNGDQNVSDVKIDKNGDVFVSPLKYHISDEGTAEVIRDDSYKKLESVVIPSEIRINEHVYSVTRIEESAFSFCDSLTSINIPSSITTIESRAFSRCNELRDIEIPSSVTSIGENTFSDCRGLTSINVSKDNPNYSSENGILYDKNKTTLICTPIAKNGIIEIPSSVTSIGMYAFGGCRGLTRIEIPSSVTSIGDAAFCGCDRMKSIKIPSSVTNIGNGAFYGCSGLTNVKIPSSVTSIGMYAFWGCRGLTRIEIPSSVTSIGNEAFYECSGLTNVKIPSSVTSIGDAAFWGCSGLTNLKISSSITSIGNEVFAGCSGLTDIEIPSSVTSIGNRAFFCCDRMKSIKIPSSVTNIGNGAFRYCSGLTRINVSRDNLYYSSEEGVLYDKNKTTLICIPGGKEGSVEIPSSVTSIGENTFSDCTGLTSINVSRDNPNYSSEEGILFDKKKTTLISVLRGRKGSIKLPSSVTSIGAWAFYMRNSLTSIEIPSSVTSIGDFAFYGCSGLTSIKIPSSVTSIGDAAFWYCENLEVIIDNSEKNISGVEDACEGCKSVKFLK